MKCRYCNIALAPLRTLTDGEFCCDEHRKVYSELGAAQDLAGPPPEGGLVPFNARVEIASQKSTAPQVAAPAPLPYRPGAAITPKFSAPAQSPEAAKTLRAPN